MSDLWGNGKTCDTDVRISIQRCMFFVELLPQHALYLLVAAKPRLHNARAFVSSSMPSSHAVTRAVSPV